MLVTDPEYENTIWTLVRNDLLHPYLTVNDVIQGANVHCNFIKLIRPKQFCIGTDYFLFSFFLSFPFSFFLSFLFSFFPLVINPFTPKI